MDESDDSNEGRGWLNRSPGQYVVGLIALVIGATGALSVLLDSQYGTSTLVYLAIPFLISVGIWLTPPPRPSKGPCDSFVSHMRSAVIIFFATSFFLREGFICVLFFLPIYLAVVGIGYSIIAITTKSDKKRVWVLPAIAALFLVEGLVPATSFERQQTAGDSRIVDADIATLQANMARPITFAPPDHLLMQIFPMPHEVEAGTLATGDIHKLHFTYRRWGVTNIDRGQLWLRIDKVTPSHIRTSIVRNDSYLAGYMDIDGTDVRFTELEDGRTRIDLSIRYTRVLDPVWYFGPLQRIAVEQSAKSFIDDIIVRQGSLAHGT